MNNGTRRIEVVKPNTMIVTADISKDSHHIYFRSGSGYEQNVFKIDNDYKGFELMMIKIKEFQNKHNLSKIFFGFESTGVYAEPLVHFLSYHDIELVQVNPRHVKRTKEISDNSPLKSDKKDPLIIADLIQLGNYLHVIIPKDSVANLRRCSATRERLVGLRTQLYNILHSQVYLIFPELINILDLKTNSAMWLLKNHPKPNQIKSLNYPDLLHEMKKISRGMLKESKIRAIFYISHNSIGIIEGSDVICYEIDLLVDQIKGLNEKIRQIEDAMKQELQNIKYAESLLSLPGIGYVSAAVLIGETGDFNNYKNADQVEKLAGLNLFENSSGKKRGRHFISKRGRPLLRKTYYYIALNSIRKGSLYHEDYKQYISRGMPHYKAIVAVARKLIRLTFALARDNKWFDNNYYKSNKRSIAA